MRTKVISFMAAAALTAAVAGAPAGASAAGQVPVKGQDHPADVFAVAPWQYFPSTVTVKQGQTFTFGNYDFNPNGGGIAAHSLDEVVPGCTKPPYTGNNPGGPGCRYPLFTSGLVDHGFVSEIKGLKTTPKGTYQFTCQVHSFMSGTLIVE